MVDLPFRSENSELTGQSEGALVLYKCLNNRLNREERLKYEYVLQIYEGIPGIGSYGTC